MYLNTKAGYNTILTWNESRMLMYRSQMVKVYQYLRDVGESHLSIRQKYLRQSINQYDWSSST